MRSLDDLERSSPGLTARLVDWLKMYKTSDGKGINQLANNERPTSASEAEAIIAECEQRWRALLAAPNARPEPPCAPGCRTRFRLALDAPSGSV